MNTTAPFADLFSRFHGRPPEAEEWPIPLRRKNRQYEWLAPEIALLATLVGRMGTAEMAAILTERLRQVTGDPAAVRSTNAIQLRVNAIGLQVSEPLGGITTREAGLEIGSYAIVMQAIARGDIKAHRVGRMWVIPPAAWTAWKAGRVFPPKGFVPLSSIREALAIRSDSKLCEFSKAGYVPTAILCTPTASSRTGSSKRGTWYVCAKVARKLVADRRAGRPMPWHGKPNDHNLRITFKLWSSRKHPSSCDTCRTIWGAEGAPKTFDDYVRRYPPLAHGAKRHLTLPWSPGLTIAEVAAKAGCGVTQVRNAIDNGQIHPHHIGRTAYISRTDATRWIERGAPTGSRASSWISFKTAEQRHGFSAAELHEFIRRGDLATKRIDNGPCYGQTFVSRHACAVLREKHGYTLAQAARKAGTTVQRFETLLRGVDWRGTGGIPLLTVQAVIDRLNSREGFTIEEAANFLDTSVEWIEQCIVDGVVRVSRAKWDRRRRYLSEPMMDRLRKARDMPKAKPVKLSSDWLLLSAAATLAGVSVTTIMQWHQKGDIEGRKTHRGMLYHRTSVMARARRYWEAARFKRRVRPQWYQAEQRATAA